MSDLASLHWMQLKSKVEAAGLPWISKADAIEKLGKLDQPVVAAEPEPVKATKVKAGQTLDRSKPYGEISGEIEGAPGARYAQGGLFFNSAGDLIGA